MTSRYAIAVRRCRSCRGKGYVQGHYVMARLFQAITVTKPCRPCDGTGKIHQWERR